MRGRAMRLYGILMGVAMSNKFIYLLVPIMLRIGTELVGHR